jgi:hypothetical protein
MRKYTFCICAVVISILLTGVLSDGSHAGVKSKPRKGDGLTLAGPEIKGSKVISGQFAGILSREIRLNGQKITINKNTRIFQVGKGLVDYGTHVGNSSIYVSAMAKDGRLVAHAVIISKPIRSGDEADRGDAGVLEPTAPR